MSGGSYDYLCWKDVDDLINGGAHYQLREMAQDLKQWFPGTRAAKETDELVRLIDLYVAEVNRRRRRLESVWHAVEWWQSNDFSRERAEEAVQELEAQRVGSGL